jgi:sugar phosphate permease
LAAAGVGAEQTGHLPVTHDDDNAKQQKPSLRRVLAIPGVVPISVAYFFLKFLRYALLMWLPYYYLEGLHFSQQTAGYMSSSFELGGMVGTPLIGYASDRYFKGRRDLTSAWFMAGASAMLVVCVAFAQGGVVVNATSMVAVGVLVIGPDSILSGTIAQDLGSASPMGPQVIGTLAGLINSVGSCGSIFQSYATAYISERYGWGVLFSIFVACSTISALILFWVAERKRVGVDNSQTRLVLGVALICAALFALSR